MSSLLGGEEKTTQSTQDRVYLPGYAENPLRQSLQLATQAAGQDFTPYTGDRVAGFTPDELQAFAMTRNMVGQTAPQFQQALNTSQQVAQQGLGGIDPNLIQSYMNPFITNVLDVNRQRSLEDFDRQKRALQSQRAQAGAFGGSRFGLAETNLYDQFRQRQAEQEANLLMQGYQGALGAAQQGLGLAGQQAGLQGQLAAQGLQSGLQGIGALEAIGAQQRGLTQQGLDVDFQEFLRQQAFPYEQAQFLAGISQPIAATVAGRDTTTETVQESSPSPLGAALGIASMAMGIPGVGAALGGGLGSLAGGLGLGGSAATGGIMGSIAKSVGGSFGNSMMQNMVGNLGGGATMGVDQLGGLAPIPGRRPKFEQGGLVTDQKYQNGGRATPPRLNMNDPRLNEFLSMSEDELMQYLQSHPDNPTFDELGMETPNYPVPPRRPAGLGLQRIPDEDLSYIARYYKHNAQPADSYAGPEQLADSELQDAPRNFMESREAEYFGMPEKEREQFKKRVSNLSEDEYDEYMFLFNNVPEFSIREFTKTGELPKVEFQEGGLIGGLSRLFRRSDDLPAGRMSAFQRLGGMNQQLRDIMGSRMQPRTPGESRLEGVGRGLENIGTGVQKAIVAPVAAGHGAPDAVVGGIERLLAPTFTEEEAMSQGIEQFADSPEKLRALHAAQNRLLSQVPPQVRQDETQDVPKAQVALEQLKQQVARNQEAAGKPLSGRTMTFEDVLARSRKQVTPEDSNRALMAFGAHLLSSSDNFFKALGGATTAYQEAKDKEKAQAVAKEKAIRDMAAQEFQKELNARQMAAQEQLMQHRMELAPYELRLKQAQIAAAIQKMGGNDKDIDRAIKLSESMPFEEPQVILERLGMFKQALGQGSASKSSLTPEQRAALIQKLSQ